jgi:hypothetical protein
MEDEVMTTKEVADFLKMSQASINQWRSRGTGPTCFRSGDGPKARVRYRKQDVLDWVNNRSATKK